MLEERFPETVAAEPELLAHHYTGARRVDAAVGYWQKAGERAIRRSANVEAIEQLKRGLALLETLPDTLERARQELPLQITLGPALMAVRGQGARAGNGPILRAPSNWARRPAIPTSIFGRFGDPGAITSSARTTRRRASWASSVSAWRRPLETMP